MAGRARAEREVEWRFALALIESVFAERGLRASFVSAGSAAFPVHRCCVYGPGGDLVAESLGKGAGGQSRVSALFEAWQHLRHQEGQAGLAAGGRVRVVPVGEVVAQPGLAGEAMLARLAADFPSARLACVWLEPLRGGVDGVWFPVFARAPACRDYPVPGDDLTGYAPYLRYSYDSGTATGSSVAEAVLHGLLEVVERDALSHALLQWYVAGDGAVRAVAREGLPADLRVLHDEVAGLLGAAPVVVEVTSDLGVPAFCAIPSVACGFPGVLGSGASLSAAYAVERALSEVAQSLFNLSLGVDRTLAGRLRSLGRWPLLERCARVDPAPLLGRLVYGGSVAEGAVGGVAEQVEAVLGAVEGAGLSAYVLRWNPGDERCPVVTVVVPGLDAFSMVHNAVPVLPTGRAVRLLERRHVSGSADCRS